MTCGIYHIKNNINGKTYIGQSVNIESRWMRHRELSKKESTYLYNSIRKYGIENFDFSIVAVLPRNIELLNLMEITFIRVRNTAYPNGYNMTFGGSNSIPTDEMRRNMSKSHTGKKLSKTHKDNISKASKICMSDPKIIEKITSKTKKPLIVDGVYYESRKAYVKSTGKKHGTVFYQLKKRGLL